MKRIVVTLLPVGQGAMNLIEIYDGEDLCHLSLIDCGTDKTRPLRYNKLPDHIKISVDYVVSKMEERFDQSHSSCFDYVLFTHRDSDHWTLFNAILEKISNTISISNRDNNARFLQWNISDTISEVLFTQVSEAGSNENPQLTNRYFSYARIYSEIADNINLSAKFRRIINNGMVIKDSLHFYCNNTNQPYHLSLSIDFQKRVTSLTIYDARNTVKLTLSTESEPNNDPKQRLILDYEGKTGVSNFYYNFDQTPHEQWSVWGMILSAQYEPLKKFPDLIHVANIIGEGLSNDYFLYYTGDDFLMKILEAEPISIPIARQFLWGGNPLVDKKSNKLTGVGELRQASEWMSIEGAIELSEIDMQNAPFRCQFPDMDNISLNILECIPTEAFKGIDLITLENDFFKKNIEKVMEDIESIEDNEERIKEKEKWEAEIEDHEIAESPTNPAILNNGTSAVSMLTIDGNSALKFLFTGDATIHTFFHMFKSNPLKKLENISGAIWTAPHHGSHHTAKGSVIRNNKVDPIFPELLSKCTPLGMVIEAGHQNRHGHPHSTFTDWVNTYLSKHIKPDDLHFVYTNTNNVRKAKWIMESYNSRLYSAVSSRQTPSSLKERHNLETPVYFVHQYTANENDTEFVHSAMPIEEIFQPENNLNLRSALVNHTSPANSMTQAVPSSQLFFRR